MIPVLLEFIPSPLKQFQIKIISGNCSIKTLISKLSLNELVEQAINYGKVVSFKVTFDNNETLTDTVATNNRYFYFTILCWAWKIDRELENNNLITFDFDVKKLNYNRFDVDTFLDIEPAKSSLIRNHLNLLKEEILDHLLIKMNEHLKEEISRTYIVKRTYNNNKLVVIREKVDEYPIKIEYPTKIKYSHDYLVVVAFILIIFVSCNSQSSDCVSRTIQGPWGGSTIGYDNIVRGCEEGWFE